jgi:hypothetical protein
MTAFLFPILLDSIGTQALLYGLIVTSILGAAVTWFFRIETTGVNLETLHTKPRLAGERDPMGLAADRPVRQVGG